MWNIAIYTTVQLTNLIYNSTKFVFIALQLLFYTRQDPQNP